MGLRPDQALKDKKVCDHLKAVNAANIDDGMAMLNKAKLITIPTIVMQAEEDKVVIINASKKLYETLASSKKTWKIYPGYNHDSELEEDRSEMDNDIVSWIRL